MAKFLLGDPTGTEVSVNKIDSKWMVDFTLPEPIRESIPARDLLSIEGVFLMSFYESPLIGDIIEYRGYMWRVSSRHHYGHRHRKHEARHISKLIVEFVSKG